MGVVNSVWRKLYGKKPVRILIIGLDAAGKTTMLYQLKLGEVVTTIPTIGFNVETLEHKNLNITMWDVGGRDKSRPLYRHYYPNTDALILVVDSKDEERMPEVKDELYHCLADDAFAYNDVPVLVIANKQDLVGALSTVTIAEKLNLDKIKRPWYIVPAVVTQGKGLYDGLDWLCNTLGKKYVKSDVTKHVSDSIKDVQKSVTSNKTLENSWTYLARSWCTVSTWWSKNKNEKSDSPSDAQTEVLVASG